MSPTADTLARLRRFNAWVERSDPKLAEETADVVATEALEVAPTPEMVEAAVNEESIILRRERPVLAIKDNDTLLDFTEAGDSEVWEERLKRAKPVLDRAVRAVGRINLHGSGFEWIGTGWLVAPTIMVTNRHVAKEFAVRKGQGFTFRVGAEGAISASIDFLQELDNTAALEFSLVKALHIEPEPGPDLAFFEVGVSGGNAALAQPIDLASVLVTTENAATIGYPAYDSRIPDTALMERLYGKRYNKKRLAPGAVTRVEQTRILHNCTTLGGNSGSAVIDLESGLALGLHFSGTFLATNYAVRADIVKQRLDDLRAGRIRLEVAPRPVPAPVPHVAAPVVGAAGAARMSGTATVTIPVTVTVSIGGATGDGATGAGNAAPQRPPVVDTGADSALIDDSNEAVAEDYRDRKGYQPDFLGDGFDIDLPTVKRDSHDVLDFDLEGTSETVLRYEHYSVVMSRSRRMCFFSAVNIDGNLSKKSKRVAWKWDPRIPKEQQIMKECYGDPPRFSRGHMTRREDPGWGSVATAKRGNEDSMHVTNVTPQMQAFNSPIWLALEDYALGHAREDAMKISVITGPYFGKKDPVMYGVRIPLAFWKIIAFIHDETEELCATGYEMNQKDSLQPEEEFVFGQFVSPQLGVATQVSIRSIESRSGISFGRLASVDPLAGDAEGLGDGGVRNPLGAFEQIRFLR